LLVEYNSYLLTIDLYPFARIITIRTNRNIETKKKKKKKIIVEKRKKKKEEENENENEEENKRNDKAVQRHTWITLYIG
jgi:hypothetical protein